MRIGEIFLRALAPPARVCYNTSECGAVPFEASVTARRGATEVISFMTKNLTEGRALPLILSFMLPMLLGMLFQQFYNVTDSILVGHFVGKGALAATGSTGSITFLIIGFANGLASGFAIPVSQRFGARDEVNLRRYAANAIVLAACFSIVVTVLSVVFCRGILTVMRTPADIMDDAYAYLVIILAGIPTTLYYNLFSGFIRALGDSRTPVLILAVSSAVNIILTAVLVICTPMGVAGAAVATVFAQLVSCALSLLHIVRRLPVLRMTRADYVLSRPHLSVLCANGLPMGLQYSITAIGSVILQSAVNGIGSDAVASVTAAGKVSCFFCCVFDALGSTMATWGGQHVGAGRLPRIRSGVRICLLIGCVFSVVCVVVFWLFGRQLAMLFLDAKETAVLADARRLLFVNACFYPLLTAVNVVRFMIQGMGFGQLSMVAGIMEMVARAAVGFWLVPTVGFLGVCFASPAAWVLAGLLLLPADLRCYHRRERLFVGEPAAAQN